MKVIAIILAMMMMVNVASAMTPMPVSVRISNEGVLTGYEIVQVNTRTGEAAHLYTDSSGFVLYDWSNSKLGWAVGDTMRITVPSCGGDSKCTVEKTIQPTPTNPQIGVPVSIVINLDGSACPVAPVCDICESTECGECSSEASTCICNCPACPDVTCPDTPVCPTPDECPAPVCPDAPVTTVMGAVSILVGYILGRKKEDIQVYYKNHLSGRFKKLTQSRIDDGTVEAEGDK